MQLRLLVLPILAQTIPLGFGKTISDSRPTHLNGVPLERDGDLNEDFHKEILMGPSNSSHGNSTEELLQWMFSNADVNHNQFLELTELQTWINSKVKEHVMQAAKDNLHTFLRIDKNHNGRLAWTEFGEDYLIKQGYSKEDAERSIRNLKSLPRRLKEQIMLDRAAWFEAATDPGGLNIDEFLTFRHPEHSHVSLLNMVTQIISDLDTDADGVLSEDEFVAVDSTEKVSAKKISEKRQEFRSAIDTDKDGKVTLQELIFYNDPSNPLHALREARELIGTADVDKDGKLSLEEVLQKAKLFLGSTAVDTAKNIHEEF
ncbi:45 kDa calcium-binding protein [Galendromus occidentalis]|uniref:45 kDa calcium-binding protein n=1 Tax=Galendromus occidentalis TaxID=34638 RepID=A0AAJ7L8W3_9ACAR|nr:45 kDa calcium-binding protein [Galendromus occidentalis]